MSDYDIKALNKLLKFIENKENYYAGFSHVIQYCDYARERNSMLWENGFISDTEKLHNSERISLARDSAIETHKQWTINYFKHRDLSAHTVETFVSTIYNYIFNK